MGARRLPQCVSACFAGTLAISAWGPARADIHLDAAFVDLLSRDDRRHPLADASGKLPVVVQVPLFADPRAMGFLPLGPGLGTIRLAPGELAKFEAEHPDLSFSIWPSFHTILDESAKRNGTLAYRSALQNAGSTFAGTGKGVVVGIVDTGLDVAHPDFTDTLGRSRVAWLLDYSHAPLGKHADVEAAFGCADPNQHPCAVWDHK